MRLSTRQIAVGGLLVAVSLVLVMTPLGFIPSPDPSLAFTIMHIPTILAGILEGPLLGAVVGGLFGLLAWLKFPAFPPLVHIPPRILIGIAAWLAWRGGLLLFGRLSTGARITLSAALAALVGTMVNTFGTLGMALFMQLLPLQVIWAIILTHFPPEAALAIILTIPLAIGLTRALKSTGITDER